ncbi:hypothetical protein A7E78_01100 [Syntrophotalea acetylenivorans]|uniref:Response regulatory domain-containing protein n=1 Tax=Syntrophotalea acetylenivorans TaxID=1842532 RepID=A0A1L3GKX4_9BACT|nr:TIGR02266 family protein [Syntrophotalea acetylenivorans]APG26579.1 hypothetical protein A7E78_01100 [Syntrophotalea acetylenivorans]
MAKKKVLLANNGDLFKEVEDSFLYRDEYELLFAANGVAAYEIAVEERPALIFMDIVLPELNGDECCRRFKAHQDLRNIPVIMVAHGDREEELQRCERAGCDDLLLKPINRQLFIEACRRHLQISQREAPRVALRLSVHYGIGGEERQLLEYSINVSTGGLFIETPDPPAASTPLRLEFFLPGQERPIRCLGRVAWLNAEDGLQNPQLPKGMGVQFVDMSLDDMRLIRSFIMRELVA